MSPMTAPTDETEKGRGENLRDTQIKGTFVNSVKQGGYKYHILFNHIGLFYFKTLSWPQFVKHRLNES